MSGFIHLHVHTEYSLLDGAARIMELVAAAAEKGMPALAITDHGSMFGVIDFYKAAQKAGIKPILGCEVYVAPRSMEDKESAQGDDANYHLVLLAENQTGYKNLLHIVSLAYTRGFYYKPRTDKATLRAHSEGLIALSACLGGEVATAIMNREFTRAREAAREYEDIFGQGNFYLELQDHGLANQRDVNRELIKISWETGIPLVATNDIHYVRREHAEVQDVLLCIGTGRTMEDEGRMAFETQEFYLKDADEMTLLFGEHPEALANTVKIAERCNVEFSFDQNYLPDYRIPAGHTVDSYLNEICFKGLDRRYPGAGREVRERLEYELRIIRDMGFSGYFLIVWDFIRFAREHGILVGPGRGSAAGSLVAYVLGITNVDPLKYDLLFERFLNPERVSMPDIDIDFCYERREEVIRYVIGHYGADKVAQIITFGTMAARAAIRDVGRALNMPYGDVDRVAKMVPAELGMTLEKALEMNGDLKELYGADPQVKKLVDMARAIEGMPRHASTHAAGVVIGREPLTVYLPLYSSTDGVVTTQFPKETVEEIGLLKMDLLGLRTLTVIGDALAIIKRTGGADIDIETIPLDDPAAYAMLGRGEAIGVFQLESSGMRNILKELKPEAFEDIIALVALYRPGPLGSGMVEDFIRRKHGQSPIKYLHPALEPILKDTYGVILYQEQVMRIANVLADYSLGEADELRRAMGKKKPQEMAKHRVKFLAGAQDNGIDADVAGQIFDLMEYFAGYGFNKSHSTAYALVAYQTAYLKANYPVAFMAALLTSIMGSSDKIAAYIEECRRMGIEVLPPDINESRVNFTVVGDKVRFGLAAVKNVGRNAIENIIEVREDEPFADLRDFCERIDHRLVTKRVVESLVKAGAFDSWGAGRARLLAVLDPCMDEAQKRQREVARGQISLFDIAAGPDTGEKVFNNKLELPDIPEYPQKELLAMEKEMLGLYISGHPLHEVKEALVQRTSARLDQLGELPDDAKVTVGGVVASLKQISTRKGELMAFMTLEDVVGSVEVVLFPRVYAAARALIRDDAVLLVRGRLNHQDEAVKIIADGLVRLEDAENAVPQLYLKLADMEDRELLNRVKQLLTQYRGESPVYLYFEGKKKMVQVHRDLWVDLNTEVTARVEEILGAEAVVVRHSSQV
jgi:DNA polymerase-3 subunit alpha